jgi:hypothetical protein
MLASGLYLTNSMNQTQPPTWDEYQHFEKCFKVLFELVELSVYRDDPPKRLYHYTGGESVRSIIESNEIHARHVLFMNDSSELNYGLGIYRDFLEGPHAIQELEEFAAFQHEFLPRPDEIVGATPIYAFCLSAAKNDLSQWRAYGNRATSYCLGFSSLELSTLDYRGNPLEYFRITYDRAAHRSSLERFIYGTFYAVKKLQKSGRKIVGSDRTVLFFQLVVWIQNLLVRMKHEAFHHEQEWHLVFRNFNGFDQADPTFMVSEAGIFIPYCVFKPATGQTKLPIKELIIGPTSNGPIAELGMRKFLRKHSLEAVDRSFCEIPLRQL